MSDRDSFANDDATEANRTQPLHWFGRTFWIKVLTGGGVGLLLTSLSVLRDWREEQRNAEPSTLSFAYVVGMLTLGPIMGILAGFGLAMREAVREAEAADQPVSPALKLLFASGLVSLICWVVLAIGLAILVVIAAT